MPSEQEIADYLAGALPPERVEAFEEEMLAAPELVTDFVKQQGVDAALRALLDPEPQRVEAAILASVRSVTDEALEKRVLANTVRARPRQQVLRSGPRPTLKIERPSWVPTFIFAVATVLVVAGGIWWNAHRNPSKQTSVVAQLRNESGARWQRPLQTGSQFRPGPLVLQAGVAELEFRSGAILLVEGPSQIELASSSRVILRSGKVAAEVPPRAKGFTVETSAGNVTDLGTRFGVQVTTGGVTEAHVFEGRVNVVPSASLGGQSQELRGDMALAIDPQRKTVTSMKSAPGLFPQRGQEIEDLLVDGGFEPGTDLRSRDIPKAPGVWSGDLSETVQSFQSIRPHSGRWMLRFLQPLPRPPTEAPKTPLAEKWQLVDLRPLKSALAAGGAVVEATAQFNHEATGARSRNRFALEILAFRGEPENAKALWLRRDNDALAQGRGVVNADDDPATWQPGEVMLTLPPGTDFLLVSVQAIGTWAAPTEQQVGRFADSVSLRLRIPPQTSAAARR